MTGPPFQTDDPEPVEFRHYEFYLFGNTDGTPVETEIAGPAAEFNWGAVPNIQLHRVVLLAGIYPFEESTTYGLGDIEAGIKY